MPYRLYVRKFLNEAHHNAGAYVLAEVADSSRPGVEPYEADSPLLTIADCGRVATLAFDLSTASSRRNSLRKAKLLADVMTHFVEALEAEIPYAEARERAQRAEARRRQPESGN